MIILVVCRFIQGLVGEPWAKAYSITLWWQGIMRVLPRAACWNRFLVQRRCMPSWHCIRILACEKTWRDEKVAHRNWCSNLPRSRANTRSGWHVWSGTNQPIAKVGTQGVVRLSRRWLAPPMGGIVVRCWPAWDSIMLFSDSYFSCSNVCTSACIPPSFFVIGCSSPYSCLASPLILHILDRSLPIRSIA